MKAPSKILLIEDDPSITASLQRVLTQEGYGVSTEERGDTGLVRAQHEAFDVVVTDLRLPGLSGLELVRQLHSARPRLPIILITAHGTTETAIEATKFGAYDYLLKPFEMTELIELLDKAVTSSRLMSEPVDWGGGDPQHDAIVGNSRAMQAIYKEIGRVANKPVTVLVRGETGTGKELIARAIYQHGDRANAPFVAVNCSAIPENLLESELFGHERGAFTGAEARRIGRFEQAHHGTIFLDEIGDLTPSTQVKLLRVLQERCLQRVGGKETIPVDVRIIAATHRDLDAAMREKQFREDLFYRLSVAVINVPALRDRTEDIPDLVRYFLRKHGPDFGAPDPSILPDGIDFLRAQSWPGNVRQLENVIRKALLLAQGFTITPDHLKEVTASASQVLVSGPAQSLRELVSELLTAAQRGELADAHARLLDAAEKEIFSQAIQLARGNQAKAARWLGVSRITMREKLTQFGLHPSQDGAGPA
jgi:nitrogen regulation protein NR(I)